MENADKYAVYRGTAANSLTLVSDAITDTTYTVTGLTNGTKYYFAIKAHSNNEWTEFSEVISATPVATVIKPSNIKATGGDGEVTLTWDAVEGATKYAVSIYKGTGTNYNNLTKTLTSTSYTATGLTNGTTYQFLVQAYVGGKWNTFTTADHVSAVPTAYYQRPPRAKVRGGFSCITKTPGCAGVQKSFSDK